MFDWLQGNKNEVDDVKRQQDFAKRQSMFGAVVQPHDELAYRAGKNDRDDLVKWQQEFDIELDNLTHELKNEELVKGVWVAKKRSVFDPKTKTYKEFVIEPLCNDWFAEEIKRQVTPFLNKNLINSNLSEERILTKLQYTHNEIACIIADNWGKHDIQNVADASAIVRIIKSYIDAAAFRALGGWTKIKDTEIAKRIEMHEIKPEEKKTGIMGLMNRG